MEATRPTNEPLTNEQSPLLQPAKKQIWEARGKHVAKDRTKQKVRETCFTCKLAESLERPLIRCSACPRTWHTSCYSPPVKQIVAGTAVLYQFGGEGELFKKFVCKRCKDIVDNKPGSVTNCSAPISGKTVPPSQNSSLSQKHESEKSTTEAEISTKGPRRCAYPSCATIINIYKLSTVKVFCTLHETQRMFQRALAKNAPPPALPASRPFKKQKLNLNDEGKAIMRENRMKKKKSVAFQVESPVVNMSTAVKGVLSSDTASRDQNQKQTEELDAPSAFRVSSSMLTGLDNASTPNISSRSSAIKNASQVNTSLMLVNSFLHPNDRPEDNGNASTPTINPTFIPSQQPTNKLEYNKNASPPTASQYSPRIYAESQDSEIDGPSSQLAQEHQATLTALAGYVGSTASPKDVVDQPSIYSADEDMSDYMQFADSFLDEEPQENINKDDNQEEDDEEEDDAVAATTLRPPMKTSTNIVMSEASRINAPQPVDHTMAEPISESRENDPSCINAPQPVSHTMVEPTSQLIENEALSINVSPPVDHVMTDSIPTSPENEANPEDEEVLFTLFPPKTPSYLAAQQALTEEFDQWLAQPPAEESMIEPTTKELLDTQVWDFIDPSKVWPVALSEDWLIAKREEIQERGGRKKNYGKLITVQNRKEKEANGWSDIQCEDAKIITEEREEMRRKVDVALGLEDFHGLGF